MSGSFKFYKVKGIRVRGELQFWSRWSGKISLHEGTHYLVDRHLPRGVSGVLFTGLGNTGEEHYFGGKSV